MTFFQSSTLLLPPASLIHLQPHRSSSSSLDRIFARMDSPQKVKKMTIIIIGKTLREKKGFILKVTYLDYGRSKRGRNFFSSFKLAELLEYLSPSAKIPFNAERAFP